MGHHRKLAGVVVTNVPTNGSRTALADLGTAPHKSPQPQRDEVPVHPNYTQSAMRAHGLLGERSPRHPVKVKIASSNLVQTAPCPRQLDLAPSFRSSDGQFESVRGHRAGVVQRFRTLPR